MGFRAETKIMKKKTFLFSLLFIVMMMLSACGGSSASSGDPFEGQWNGTLDLTKQFEDGIIANYPDLEAYVDFEELVFVMDVVFEEGMMSMSVEEDSVTHFMTNFEEGMQKIGRESLEDWLTTQDLTLEEVVAESGTDEETYLASIFEQMGIDKMTTSMKEITNASLEGLSKIEGPYTFDETQLKLHHDEDNTFEGIGYEFKGKDLILTIKGDGFSLRVECEK